MTNWKTSANRKKHQRAVNKIMRSINHAIEIDELWRGRFYMRQVNAPTLYSYSDGSGHELCHFHFIVIDRKTNAVAHAYFNSSNEICSFQGAKLWRFMNDAIVEEFNPWAESPSPIELFRANAVPIYK